MEQIQVKKWKCLNTKAITSNLNLVFKTRNISKLNKPTYDFIMNLSGFIAHYDLYGFQSYYSDLRDLIRDLEKSTDVLNPEYYLSDFFQKEEESKDYYKSKTETLKQIKPLIEKYKTEIEEEFKQKEKDEDINTIKVLMNKHNLNNLKI